MAASFHDVPSSRIMYVHELLGSPRGAFPAVRIVVRVRSYDAAANVAVCEDACFAKNTVEIDTSFITDTYFQPNELYNMLGDVKEKPGGQIFIKARIFVSAQGLDLDFYKSALELRRKALGESFQVAQKVKGSRKRAKLSLLSSSEDDDDDEDMET